MAFSSICGIILFWIGWAVFLPKSFGREMREWRDKIADGWDSPPQDKP